MHSYRPSIFVLAAVALVVGASACGYDGTALNSVKCDREGAQSQGRTCRDGFWTGPGDASTVLDTGQDAPDAPSFDAGTDPQACEPPNEQQICTPNGRRACGTFVTADECGNRRSVDCGDCPGEERCEEGLCRAPTCEDALQNQEETDVDCGGPNCAPCPPGAMCEEPSDCVGGLCGVERSRNGLIALYTFEEAAGQVVYDRGDDYVAVAKALGATLVFGQDFDGQMRDASGNGHDGVLEGGAEWVTEGGPTSALPGYLHHDAAQDALTRIAHHDDLGFTDAMTLAYWRRHSGQWDDAIGIDVSKGDDAWAVKNRDSTATNLEWDLRGGAAGSERVETGAGGVEAARWQFVVLTWDGTEASIFVDDMTTPKAGPQARSAPIGANQQDMLLAAQNDVGDNIRRHTNVDLAGLSAFDRALDAGERRLLKNASQPVDLQMQGAVTWESDAVHFNGGALRSDDTSALYDAILEGPHAFTLEAWVEADSTNLTGPARIVSLSDGTSRRNLTLGVENDELHFRLRHEASDDNGTPPIVLEQDGVSTALEHYVITLQDEELHFYRNGALVTAEDVPGDLSDWDTTYPLLIGNETGMNRTWRGNVHLVAFYDRALALPEVEAHFERGVGAAPPENVCQ